MTRLLARYLLDFNADYLRTPTDRRRTAAYVGLTLLGLALAVFASGLVPGLQQIMGW